MSVGVSTWLLLVWVGSWDLGVQACSRPAEGVSRGMHGLGGSSPGRRNEPGDFYKCLIPGRVEGDGRTWISMWYASELFLGLG